MLLDEHRKFLRRDMDPDVLSATDPDLVIISVSQVLSLRSDLSESGQIEATARFSKSRWVHTWLERKPV